MVKKAFWEGFEKSALSSELLRRAERKAKQLEGIWGAKIKTAPKGRLDEVFKKFIKRSKQHSKFQLAALDKREADLLEKYPEYRKAWEKIR